MSKTKLLILLLISFIISSCINDSANDNKTKYSLGYISGEYDGLILKNLLTNNLSDLDMYDENSVHKIESSISHSSRLFITNIDNTSDRMRVDTEITIEIINQKFKCVTHKFEESISQYYIFADSDKYISNNNAEKKIREYNTEALVKEFINKLKKPKAICKKLNE
tara:strand:- start:1703 stop:2200 length:498 start_codon:yes stop_codon:yes gene_type:complete